MCGVAVAGCCRVKMIIIRTEEQSSLHKLLCGDFNDVLLGLLASNLEITITTHIYTTCRSAGDGRFINSTRRRAKVESFPGYERTQGTPPPPPPADWK